MITRSTRYRRLKAMRLAKKAQHEKNLKVRALNGDEEKEDEVSINGVAFKVPEGTDVKTLSDGMSDHEIIEMIDIIQDPIGHVKKNDPSDQYMPDDVSVEPEVRRYAEDNYPDGWRKAYYPGGKKSLYDTRLGSKPNTRMIMKWVEDVKFASKSQRGLELEYKKMYGVDQMGVWTDKKYNHLVRSVAFAVSRKIWYVGRKPSDMIDIEWDNATKHMRPAQGTFSKDEDWGNGSFPYGEGYIYSSGEESR